MKKLLAGILLFVTACQSPAATEPVTATPTVTRRPTSFDYAQDKPATATVTRTSVPTSTVTSTPFPLYFSDEFDSDLSAWTSFVTNGDSTPQVTLGKGTLNLNFSTPNTWYYAVHNAHTYSRVHVEASFDSTEPRTAYFGVICMYNERSGWFEYTLSGDGTYNLLMGQWLSEGIARYTPIVHDTTEYLSPGRTNYEIGITCEEKVLFLHINGKLFRKINVARYGLKEGKVGIAAAVFENVPAVAHFDWFGVSEPVP
jgi:hypothetical protein